MRIKKIVSGISILLLNVAASAQQQTITLQEALKNAETHYPSFHQKLLLEEAGKETQKLLNASLYPQLNVAGQATYQSEVTRLDVPGSVHSLTQKPDNYNIGLEM